MRPGGSKRIVLRTGHPAPLVFRRTQQPDRAAAAAPSTGSTPLGVSAVLVCTRVLTMLEIVALGGLGEFGMNMLALSWGETTIIVDAGVMFPDPELLGVDRIIPDLTYLQQKGGADALVLTHGHEDHIGAVPHVVPHVHGPVYGTPLTLAL